MTTHAATPEVTGPALPGLVARALHDVDDAVLLLQANPDGSHVVAWANPAWVALTGWQLDELQGRRSLDLVDREPLEVNSARVRRRDGTSLLVTLTVTDVPSGPGEAPHRLFVASRRRVHETTVLAAMQRHGSDVVVVVAENGEIRWASDSIERELGWRLPELVGSSVLDLLHAEDVEPALRALAGGEDDLPLSWRVRHADGTWRLMALAATDQRHDPEIGGFVITARDVTERERAVQELARSEEIFRTLLVNTPALFLATDADGVITLLDGGALAAFGATPEQVAGRAVEDIFGRYPQALASIRRALAGEASSGVVQIDDRYYDAWYAPRRDADGRVVGCLAGSSDITQRVTDAEALRTTAGRFQALVQNTTDIITIINPDGTVRWSSPAGSTILGYPEGSFGGVNVFALIHPDDVERVGEAFTDGLTRVGQTIVVQFRLARVDGSYLWVETTAANRLDDPVIRGIVTSTRDVSDRVRATQLVEDQSRILESIASGEPLERTLQRVTDLVVGGDPAVRSFVLLAGERDGWDVRLDAAWLAPLVSRDGRILGLLVREDPRQRSTSTPAERQVVAVAVHLAAIALERHEAMHRLAHAAAHDPLTGLTNRSALVEHLEGALERTHGSAGRVAVLFCDLDRFKLINDSLGHHVGDQVLVDVARRVASCLREGDVVARFGGDEFVLVLEDADRATAERVARRVLGSLQEPFRLGDLRLGVSASIGICLSGRHQAASDLLRHADTAMYQAKRAGLGAFHVYETAAMGEQVRRRLQTESDLRRALEQDELVVHVQPALDLDGRVGFVEALVRWNHPARGLVPPVQFLDVAEEAGLMRDIGLVVLDQTCALLATLGPTPPSLAVNLAADQFRRFDVVRDVEQALARHGVSPEHLVVEVTEDALADAGVEVVQGLATLRALGVRVAVDDFGTGHSSLARLRALPVDHIKIDRSFVTPLGTGREHTAVVQAVVTLGHALGLTVVAEGVETSAQLEELRTVGCDLAQGYLLARPMPTAHLAGWLESVRTP